MTRHLFQHLTVYTSILLLLSCSHHKKEKNDLQIVSDTQWVNTHDSLVTNAKFDLYCIFAGLKFAFKDNSAHLIDYSSCDLKVEALSHTSDTLELNVGFYYNEKKVNAENCLENGVRRITRILYSLKENKIIEYFTPENMGFYEATPTSRYFKPLQPEVISYIVQNRNIIHPWFKAEAIRRGIIKY